jgi:hypothetical protein
VERAFWPATSAFVPTFFMFDCAPRRLFARLDALSGGTEARYLNDGAEPHDDGVRLDYREERH